MPNSPWAASFCVHVQTPSLTTTKTQKPSPASGTAVLRSFVSKASWGGLFDGLFVFLFQSSSNKLQINAMHIPLNSLVRILRIKHIAHLQSNRRLKSFQVSSICIFQHLRLWDLFNSQAYISPHETHEVYLVGIVLQRHKGIPLAQYHAARTVHWTVPDEHVAAAQNTPSAHIQDLCSTVLFPGAKGKKNRQCFVKAWFDQSFNRMLWTTITSAFPATCVVSYDILRLCQLFVSLWTQESFHFQFWFQAHQAPPLPTLGLKTPCQGQVSK